MKTVEVLPVPAERDPSRVKDFETNPNHGLWGFFNAEKRPMISPEDEAAYGMLCDHLANIHG